MEGEEGVEVEVGSIEGKTRTIEGGTDREVTARIETGDIFCSSYILIHHVELLLFKYWFRSPPKREDKRSRSGSRDRRRSRSRSRS